MRFKHSIPFYNSKTLLPIIIIIIISTTSHHSKNKVTVMFYINLF